MACAVADPDLSQGATGPVTEAREAALGRGVGGPPPPKGDLGGKAAPPAPHFSAKAMSPKVYQRGGRW